MNVLIKSKTTFDAVELNNVTNIAYSSGTYTITYGSPSQTATYSAASHTVTILFKEV